jgi:hypothetical protein
MEVVSSSSSSSSSFVDHSALDHAIQLNNRAVTMMRGDQNENNTVDLLSKALFHMKTYTSMMDSRLQQRESSSDESSCDASPPQSSSSSLSSRIFRAVRCPPDSDTEELRIVHMYERMMMISPSLSSRLHSAGAACGGDDDVSDYNEYSNLSVLCCCCIVFNLATAHHRSAMRCLSRSSHRHKAVLLYNIVVKNLRNISSWSRFQTNNRIRVSSTGWEMTALSLRAASLNNLVSMLQSDLVHGDHHACTLSSSIRIDQAMNELSNVITLVREMGTAQRQLGGEEGQDSPMCDRDSDDDDMSRDRQPSPTFGGILTEGDIDSMMLNIVVSSVRRIVAPAA